MLDHAKDCAIHQAPFCTCGAISRWASEQLRKPKPAQPTPRQAKAA